jgi:hypothetical protein
MDQSMNEDSIIMSEFQSSVYTPKLITHSVILILSGALNTIIFKLQSNENE